MALVMVLSLMTGYLMQLSQRLEFQRQQQAAAEPTPLPTFAPPPSTASVTFEREALQASGLFSLAVPQPPEWGAVESSYDSFANRARLVMRNPANVVEASAEAPGQPVNNLDELSTVLNDQALGSSWRNYSEWRETQRTTVERGGRAYLQLDFELQFQNRTYVARQASWVEDGRVYSVRVVTPENATDFLVFLLDQLIDTFTVYERFAGTPLSWTAYYDPALNHIIRYPQNWQVTDAADGFPASIQAEDIVLRVEAVEGETIDGEGTAASFVEGLPDVNEVTSVEAAESGDLTGYAVAYRYATITGESGSGAVMLLNGEDIVHVANLRVADVDADLNAPTDDEQLSTYYNVLSTFSPMAGVEYAEPSVGSAAPLTDPQQTQQNPINLGGF
jgi:hypothetical protein